MEGSTDSKLSFSVNMAAMIVDYFLAKSQPDTCPFICCPIIQSLKNVKNFRSVLLFKPDTVIDNPDMAIAPVRHQVVAGCSSLAIYFIGCDLNFGWHTVPCKFQCIVEKIIKQLVHLQRVRLYDRQHIIFY